MLTLETSVPVPERVAVPAGQPAVVPVSIQTVPTAACARGVTVGSVKSVKTSRSGINRIFFNILLHLGFQGGILPTAHIRLSGLYTSLYTLETLQIEIDFYSILEI